MNVEPDRFFRPSTPKKSVPNAIGGRDNDVFNKSPQPESPQKGVKSRIFADEADCGEWKKGITSARQPEKTADRLFGNMDISPRKFRLTDTTRSSIFSTEDSDRNVHQPRRCAGRNPITGKPMKAEMNGHVPTENGVNGVNGHHHNENGYHPHDVSGMTNGHVTAAGRYAYDGSLFARVGGGGRQP